MDQLQYPMGRKMAPGNFAMDVHTARKKVFLLLVFFLALRILAAATIELGNDEVYYRLYAKYPGWSYFDHPGMLGWLVRLFTFNLYIDQEWALRLPALVFGTVNTWLAFELGRELKSVRTGYYAALLFAGSLYISVICGVFILPDTPQSFFWMLALLVVARLFFDETQTPAQKNGYWLLFGLLTGLSVISKYHGVFLWAGAGLYILVMDRRWLKNPFIYLAGLLTLLCMLPIVVWNQQHQWVSFTFHSSRTLDNVSSIDWNNVIRQIAGELFYNNPINAFLIIIALASYRRIRYIGKKKFCFLLCMSLPLILFVWVMSTRRETLPHWTGPSYMALMMLAAAWLEQCSINRQQTAIPLALKASSGSAILLLLLGTLQINTGLLPLQKQENATTLYKDYNKDDFTLDMFGWAQTQTRVNDLLTSRIRSGQLNRNFQFVQSNWFNGAHVDYYVARPMQKNTLVLGTLKNIHQFYWINKAHDWDTVSDYCFVTNSRYYQAPEDLPDCFKIAPHTTDTFPIYRNGKVAEAVFVTIFRNVSTQHIDELVHANQPSM